MGAVGAIGGWFEPGDDVERAWDEAEAILLACDDLDGVMETIRDAGSPVEARRALKVGFGFTGRQAALLLTLPVLSFTRSERNRMDESRRSRMALLADVTGAIPVVRDPVAHEAKPPESVAAEPEPQEPVAPGPVAAEPVRPEPVAPVRGPSAFEQPAPAAPAIAAWGAEFDGTLDRIRSAMDEHYGVAPAVATGAPAGPAETGPAEPAPTEPALAQAAAVEPAWAESLSAQPEAAAQRGGRSSAREAEEAAVVLDEQIGELCEAIGDVLGIEHPSSALLDDPRDPGSRTGQLLDSCGVDDATGIRTLLWHLRRTGLESVEGLLPFAEPLTGPQGFDAQAAHFEAAMASGGLGSVPGDGSTWAGRMWPIAQRRGYGYAVLYRSGPGAGAVWAYGGGEPLHLMWDSVVDVLVEVYQALTAGEPCDAALAAAAGGRVTWTNIS